MMRIKKLKREMLLVTATLSSLLFSGGLSSAQQNATFSVPNGTSGEDYRIYQVDGSDRLYLDHDVSKLNEALAGSSTYAGGNIELFAQSDTSLYDSVSAGGAFATADPITMQASFSGGQSVSMRSLNGADWFTTELGSYDTEYGASNLANQWFGDFLESVVSQADALGSPGLADLISGNELSLYTSFRDEGGFAQLSDPNISYAQLEGDQMKVGLAGFENASPRIIDLITSATDLSSSMVAGVVPDGLQFSEVVMIEGQVVYGFSATPSGVVLEDGVQSYSGNYEVTYQIANVPEPSSMLFLSIGAIWFLKRSRK